MDKYDQNTTTWSRWKMRLEGAFSIYDVKDEKKTHFLLHNVGQMAFDIVADKLSHANPYTKPYAEIVAILNTHFDLAPLEVIGNFKFHSRFQHES